MEEVRYTRKELYDLVWSSPLSVLARKYNISDNGLRKICLKMNIPLPETGYWQKIRYGKSVKTKQLPENYSGKNVVFLNEKIIDLGGDIIQVVNPLEALEKEIKLDLSLPLRVPERLTNPDRLITNTIKHNEAINRYDYRNGAAYPSRIDVLNIDVSKASLPRALRLMDTLIKLLRARNHGIKFQYAKTFIEIDGEEIEIRIRERTRVSASKDNYGGRTYENTGELIFIMGDYHRKEINERKATLETKLPTMLAIIELEGKRLKEEHIERERRQKIREEQERIAREFKELQNKESRKFKDLFLQATRLHQTNIIRGYVQSVESFALKNGNISEELKAWIKWANDKIDWYDPMINKEDSLLDETYKSSLFREFLKEWQ